MPYLEYLFCERCGNHAHLDLDPGATVTAYRKDGRETTSIHQQTMIWDYMIYTCGICGNQFRYTYRDVELRVRSYFSAVSLEFKEYFDKVIEEHESREQSGEKSPTPEPLQDRRAKSAERIRNLYTAKL